MINFPSAPTLGQQYTYLSRTWEFTGVAWKLLVSSGGGGGSGNSYFPGGW